MPTTASRRVERIAPGPHLRPTRGAISAETSRRDAVGHGRHRPAPSAGSRLAAPTRTTEPSTAGTAAVTAPGGATNSRPSPHGPAPHSRHAGPACRHRFPADPAPHARHPPGQPGLPVQPELPALPGRGRPAAHRDDGRRHDRAGPRGAARAAHRDTRPDRRRTRAEPTFPRAGAPGAGRGRARDRPLQPDHPVRTGQEDLADFVAEQGVEITASLPSYSPADVDRQRGDGVLDRSIAGLRDRHRAENLDTVESADFASCSRPTPGRLIAPAMTMSAARARASTAETRLSGAASGVVAALAGIRDADHARGGLHRRRRDDRASSRCPS